MVQHTSTTVRRIAALLPHHLRSPSHLPKANMRILKNIVVVHADDRAAQRPRHPACFGDILVSGLCLQLLVQAVNIGRVDAGAVVAASGYAHGRVFGVVGNLVGGLGVVDREWALEDGIGEEVLIEIHILGGFRWSGETGSESREKREEGKKFVGTHAADRIMY